MEEKKWRHSEPTPTCCRVFKHLPGDLREGVLQLLDEGTPLRVCAEHLADLLHQLHRPGHVEAVLLAHLRSPRQKSKGGAASILAARESSLSPAPRRPGFWRSPEVFCWLPCWLEWCSRCCYRTAPGAERCSPCATAEEWLQTGSEAVQRNAADWHQCWCENNLIFLNDCIEEPMSSSKMARSRFLAPSLNSSWPNSR